MVRAVVDKGLTKAAAARPYNTSTKTVAKWVERFGQRRRAGIARPLFATSIHRPTRLRKPACTAIEALRRQRFTGEQIAVDLASATVSRILRRLGLNRLRALEPAEPVRRYERERPGELIHIDIKKLGKFNQIGHRITGDRTGQSNSRGVGWEYAHVCVDDHSRIAFADIMPNQKKRSATAFLRAAVAYYAKLGVKVERVMTDNGSCYRSFAFRRTCKRLQVSGTFAPSPIRQRLTARSSASFSPACASGPYASFNYPQFLRRSRQPISVRQGQAAPRRCSPEADHWRARGIRCLAILINREKSFPPRGGLEPHPCEVRPNFDFGLGQAALGSAVGVDRVERRHPEDAPTPECKTSEMRFANRSAVRNLGPQPCSLI